MSERFRLGLVGAGAIARAYAAAIAGSTSARLVAVVDTNADAAEALAKEAGAAVFGSHLDLAEAGVCDAVLVTSPPATHAPIVIDLVSRGLPVLCEKPLSVDFDSARSMIRAAQEHDVLLSMASKFRFSDDVIAARNMIRAGEIGTPLMLENVFTGVVDMTSRWNSDPVVSGGGVLIDNGTHSADIIRFLLGPIAEVLAVATPPIQRMPVEDGVRLLARTTSGAQASVETSWSIHKDRSAFIEVYGTEGAIEVGWKGSRIRRKHGGAWEPFGGGYDKVASFARQIDHFVGVLQGQILELVGAEDALASVAVIQATYQSMASGTWEKVGTGELQFPRMKLAQ
jgi:predicted dehydrogenase